MRVGRTAFALAQMASSTLQMVTIRVKKLTPDGKLVMTLGKRNQPSDTGCTSKDYRTIKGAAGPFNFPTDVALDKEGNIYVSDGYANARVHKFSKEGELLLSWGEPGRKPGQFNVPHGIFVLTS